ncbi:MAG: 2-keto-3-deoxygluconate permease [Firmicutes bacterium]|nr:2-keto-3-deoxygluconate permease [Bacillota bacterium]
MLKLMRKIPAGTVLVPMLISALINTFAPNFFKSLGGLSETLFTGKGTNYLVALVTLCASTALDIKTLGHVLKKQGLLMAVKFGLAAILGFIYIKLFGMEGILGVSAIAFVVGMCAINPSLYLGLMNDYGTKEDEAAFGFVGIFCVPAISVLVFSTSHATPIDWMPLLSALFLVIIGVIIGNLDKDLGKFLGQVVGPLTIFLGIAAGSTINLKSAFKSGPSGILLVIFFYLFIMTAMYLFETKALKSNGIAAVGLSAAAGLNVVVPNMIAEIYPEYASYAATATTQLVMAVVITAILTPIMVKYLAKKKGISRRGL